MRKKTETRKKFGRICALVVVGMFVVMTSVSVPADDPFDWTTTGNIGTGTEVFGTINDDDLRIITSGMQRMVVTSGGLVGIGTMDPQFELDVSGDVRISGTIHVGNSAVQWLVITPDGKVGIGTPNPAEKLDVVGTVQMTGFKMPVGASSGYVLTSDAFGQGTWQRERECIGGSGTPNYIAKFINSTTIGDSIIYESPSGNIGIGTTEPVSRLDMAGETISNVEQINSGPGTAQSFRLFGRGSVLFVADCDNRNPSSRFNWYINGEGDANMKMTLTEEGNLGIGTILPDAKLHIVGSVRIVDGTQSAGYVLTSDANGLASWQNVGGVPSGAIIMWSGATVPDGWALCDGTQNTPDLRDRFIVGAGNSYSIGNTGGTNTNNIQHSHTYSGTTNYETYYEYVNSDGPYQVQVADHPHKHSYNGITAPAGSTSLENRPPYFALAFIMKL